MFSVQQKRDISDAVQKILRATNHAELPTTGEIEFHLRVEGAEDWSYAAIRNNGAVGDPSVNPHNELMASNYNQVEEEDRLFERAEEVAQHTDPRATPEEFYREMLDKTYTNLAHRVQSLENKDNLHRKLYSDLNSRLEALENYLKEIMEDDVIRHYGDELRNLMTAIRQLGNPDINKTLKGG